jgi:hypothetical protein
MGLTNEIQSSFRLWDGPIRVRDIVITSLIREVRLVMGRRGMGILLLVVATEVGLRVGVLGLARELLMWDLTNFPKRVLRIH